MRILKRFEKFKFEKKKCVEMFENLKNFELKNFKKANYKELES